MQKKIALFVTSVHIILIVMFCFSPVKKTISPKKHIAVRTIQPKTRTLTAAAPRTTKGGGSSETAAAPKPKASKKETVKKEAPKKEAPLKSKTTSPKTAAAKPAPAKSKPINQKKPAMVEKGKPKKPPKAPDKVWKEINEALAKIDDKVYSKSQSKLDVPQMKGTSPSKFPFPDFGEMDEGEGTEEETLGSFLSSSLNLPEFGEVKIQLTIKKDGSVARLSVLQAESKKNKAYLEKHLPLLKFPLILDKEKTFTLTFCNEI
jgi:outer membrane biosynthesis protein TonB